MSSKVSSALRLCLVVIGLGALFGQAGYVPLAASQAAQEAPELAYLALPYAIAMILVLVCVQIALIALWKLLARVEHGWIFDAEALRWVDVIIVSAAAATVITVATVTHLISWVGVGGPFAVLVQGASLVGGVSFVLLMVVVRGLLASATRMKSEMAEVI